MPLVAYDSSEDEDVVQDKIEPEKPKVSESISIAPNAQQNNIRESEPPRASETDLDHKGEVTIIGPALGPSAQPPPDAQSSFPPLEEEPSSPAHAPRRPGSPYTSTRSLLRDLTLPTIPNLDIPPSPPGSPPPGLETTTKKFEHFLELKKKGTHFNSKIAQSSALKNPSLMDKLMGFAELDHVGQYTTTLSGAGGWDSGSFPRWAYKEELRKTQSDLAAGRARKAGGAVEFVKSSGGDGGSGSRESTPPVTGKRKSRFDT